MEHAMQHIAAAIALVKEQPETYGRDVALANLEAVLEDLMTLAEEE